MGCARTRGRRSIAGTVLAVLLAASLPGAVLVAPVSAQEDDAEEDAGAGDAADDEAVDTAGSPEYEITGSWVNPPDTIARGEPVVAEWRVNVNDAQEPPANEPVPNVTVTFNVDKAFFADMPDMCLTGGEGVDPPSSFNDDRTSLTCNFGTVRMGMAIVLQTPVTANGITGDEVTHDGTIEGQTVVLDPIPIENPFIMDIHYGGNSQIALWDDDTDPTYVDVDVQWSLRMGRGSDPGPDTVTYRLDVGAVGVNAANIDVGVHPPGFGVDGGVAGCTRFDGGNADGHPWSSVPTHFRHTNFVESCTLTRVSPGVFELTLTGINYELQNVPTHDSNAGAPGNPLPPDWDYIASGSLWFRVFTNEAGSLNVVSQAPVYTAPTGQTFQDLPGNNTTNKAYTRPGGWSSAWVRGYTQSGGTNWDDTYRVSPGTTIMAYSHSAWSTDNVPPTSQYGNCIVFDTAFVTFQGDLSDPDHPQWFSPIRGLHPAGGGPPEPLDNPPAIQYHTGGVGDPDEFDCGAGTWTTTEPADLSTVTAIRIQHPHSLYGDEDVWSLQLLAWVRINDDVPVGQDVWTFGSSLRNGTWIGPGNTGVITPTPGARYPHTNGHRDIVRIVGAVPWIAKASDRSTVTPGQPTGFTLTYAATGSGIVPDTVDGYQITDTLPVGMTYEPGSADPEPAVTTDAQGRQILTWTLDGVETNVQHELRYEAVPDSSIPPGSQLTNTAVSSYGGETSRPASRTVTTTSNGYTTILKTSDVDYIPNRLGDGVGTGSWTVTIESFDPQPQAFTDTIDILPYNGDLRGTSYSGTYRLDDVVVPAGATVYYTDADPATVNYDPADPSNGVAGDPTGNTVGWTTTAPAEPTAIRVIGPALAPGGELSFQVVITTDGAQPQDVYWNSAQARAEHTQLVMRTSAALVVTDYEVVKVSDPASGSNVDPGDVINYTITVTQVGDVPAGAVLVDDLSEVLDDAIYNGDAEADIGTVSVDGDVLSWEGDVPVGGVATITYSVTMKDAEAIEAEGDALLRNVVTSPGCRLLEHCTTTHSAGRYAFGKTSDPASGEEVQVGDVITYSLEVAATFGRIEDAIVVDDLSDVLDDARWNDDLQVASGEAALEGTTLTWTGALDVDEVVVITYSVTVTGEGDGVLNNVVTSPDERSVCVDEDLGCATSHPLGPATVPAADAPPSPPSSQPASQQLPRTGAGVLMLLLTGAGLVGSGGLLARAGRSGGPAGGGPAGPAVALPALPVALAAALPVARARRAPARGRALTPLRWQGRHLPRRPLRPEVLRRR